MIGDAGAWELTALLCIHFIAGGGSGECCTMHVRLTVEPVLMYISGPPTNVVIGSERSSTQ